MSRRNRRKSLISIILLVVAAAAIGGALYIKDRPASSTQPTANYNPQTKTSTPGGSEQGGVVDTTGSGSNTPTTPPATTSGISSSSGVITLASPASGVTLTNGTRISGTATGVATVQYRVKDTVRGVIASGPLNVVNGTFSGTLQGLAPASSSGTLEIYDYNSQTGAEENDVKINVAFTE